MKILYSPRLSAAFVIGGAATEQLMRPSPHNRGGVGKLPTSKTEALSTINALLGDGEDPLTESDVYIRYMEAANDNFVSDRYCFLGESTLKNVATDAAIGFAFMNSHRTGGYGKPAELPLGRTFCGRYEVITTEGEEGASVSTKRAVVGIYMLRGLKPNGESGVSTDDMNRMIAGRTVFDVSVGVYGGKYTCDVCGHGVWDLDEEYRYLCRHVPGSTYNMTDAEIAAQEARGVDGGRASYTLDDAHCNEVSAVYDGAVPGAGFAKAATYGITEADRETVTNQLSSGYGLKFTVSDLDRLTEHFQSGTGPAPKLSPTPEPTSDAPNPTHSPNPPHADPPGSAKDDPFAKEKKTMKLSLKALRQALGLGENEQIEIEDNPSTLPAPAPAPDFTAQITAAVQAAVTPLSTQLAAVEANNTALAAQLAESQKATAESQKAAQLTAAQARVATLRRQQKLTHAAAQSALAFAEQGKFAEFDAVISVVESNASITALGGVPVAGADDVTLGSDAGGMASNLTKKAQDYANANGIKLHEAIQRLAADPEFAAEYAAARQEGSN